MIRNKKRTSLFIDDNKWLDGEGKIHDITGMETSHLENILRMDRTASLLSTSDPDSLADLQRLRYYQILKILAEYNTREDRTYTLTLNDIIGGIFSLEDNDDIDECEFIFIGYILINDDDEMSGRIYSKVRKAMDARKQNSGQRVKAVYIKSS